MMTKIYVPEELWREAEHWVDEDHKARCPIHLLHMRGKAGVPVSMKALKRAENTLCERALNEDGVPARKLDDLRVQIIKLIVKNSEAVIREQERLKK